MKLINWLFPEPKPNECELQAAMDLRDARFDREMYKKLAIEKVRRRELERENETLRQQRDDLEEKIRLLEFNRESVCEEHQKITIAFQLVQKQRDALAYRLRVCFDGIVIKHKHHIPPIAFDDLIERADENLRIVEENTK